MGDLWRNSLTFRRVVAVLVVALAAFALFLASNIPRPASLPNEDVDKLGVIHAGDQFRIYKPRADAGTVW